MADIVLGNADAALSAKTVFMELTFPREAKKKQTHDCDDCHKEK